MKIKCYNCGGDVIVADGSRMGICSACMVEIPVPEDVPEITGSFSEANRLLSEGEFEKALEEFRGILMNHPTEAAACWGMALSEYGIEYVSDPVSGEHIPTLHRLSERYFTENHYYRLALDYAADEETAAFYGEQGKRIDEIQRRSLAISNNEDPYDIFICYKQTGEDGKRTPDSRMADDFYRELTGRGYRVFFAEKTLTAGEEYEPRIFAALQSARLMIAIASMLEYYTAVWVSNEWSRYAALTEREEEGAVGRLLVPVYRGIDREELPDGLRRQPRYVDMTRSANPRQALWHIVAEHFDVKGNQVPDDVSRIRRAVGTAEKISMDISAEKLLTRAMISLAGGAFDEAERVLKESLGHEETADAYWALMMCELKIPGTEALSHHAGDITKSDSCRKALAAAEGEKKERYEAAAANCMENLRWEEAVSKNRERQNGIGRIFVQEMENRSRKNAVVAIYDEEKKRGDELRWEIAAEEREQKRGKWMELLLFSAFLLPFLHEKAGTEGSVEFWMTVFTIGSSIFSFAALAMVEEYTFEKDHGFFTLILIISYGVCVWKFRHITWLTLLGLNGLWYLIRGIRRRFRKSFLRGRRRELEEKRKERDKFGALLGREAAVCLKKEMEVCRKTYNSPREFEEILEIWVKEAEAVIDAMVRRLYEEEKPAEEAS